MELNRDKLTSTGLLIIIITICSAVVVGYSVEPPKTAHQHITNESKEVWTSTPSDIKEKLTNSFNNIYDLRYDDGDDIIDGSGEEDTPPLYADSLTHFWEPDSPEGGDYDDGLGLRTSSYDKAKKYWITKVISYYTGKEGKKRKDVDQDQAYYWFGRTVHLLEDAAVPAHTHLDPHVISDSLEDYTGETFRNWAGQTYQGNQYNPDNLPNTGSLNWADIQPSGLTYDQISLFRIFWYTAQKTQYYASDDENGNSFYYKLNNQQQNFSTSLWNGDNVVIISNKETVPANIAFIANATMPHAMKAVAGLYRLFWNTVRDELRLDVPVNFRNSYQKDRVYGSVKHGKTWFTEMKVFSNKVLEVELIYSKGCSNDVSITITNPSGTTYTNSTFGCGKKRLEVPAVTGTWNVTVRGNSVTSGIHQFEVTAGLAKKKDAPGGINFTSLNLNYVSTCDPSQVNFVMKGTEASPGDTIINSTNATNNAMDYFLTGLVIPNNRIWITLDILEGSEADCSPGYRGDASRNDVTMRQTKLGQALLDADVKLKQDQFGQDTDSYQRSMTQNWIDLVKESPYWSDIQAQGFNTFPSGVRRTWISPSRLDANGTGCTVFITNVTLNVSYVWDSISLDLSSYSFNQNIIDDLNSRLQTWKKRNIDSHYGNVTSTTINEINNDPKYAELRRAAVSTPTILPSTATEEKEISEEAKTEEPLPEQLHEEKTPEEQPIKEIIPEESVEEILEVNKPLDTLDRFS